MPAQGPWKSQAHRTTAERFARCHLGDGGQRLAIHFLLLISRSPRVDTYVFIISHKKLKIKSCGSYILCVREQEGRKTDHLWKKDWSDNHYCVRRASLVAQTLKRLSAIQNTRVWSLGWEDPLEKEMAAHSSILAWRIPWTAEPSRLLSMGSQRVGHDWYLFKIEWDLLYFGKQHETQLSINNLTRYEKFTMIYLTPLIN